MFKYLMALSLVAIITTGNSANSKTYSTCNAAYRYYLSDKSKHKAFAKNGNINGIGTYACGGSGGDVLDDVVNTALRRCNIESKKVKLKGQCKVTHKK